MDNIVYTAFSGAPSHNSGGANNIINKLLRSLDYKRYYATYISKHHRKSLKVYNENIFSENISILYDSNSFYRNIVESNIYLLYHYYKGINYFKSIYKSDDFANCILHSHDILSFCRSENKLKKTILTIHTKGSYANDFRDYRKSSYLLKNMLIKFRQIEKEAFESADIVTFPSTAAKELFLEETKIKDQNKIRIVYNGIDLEQIKNISKQSNYLSDINEDTIYLINIADHISVKNVDKILKLVYVLKKRTKKNITLFNAGTGPLTEYYNNICKELNIIQNVKFLGRIDNNSLISLMKKCNYYISLSERVIFDVSILEALACNMIVIANNDGGNKEVIKNNVNGYLVNFNEIEEIADMMIEYNKNPSQMNTTDILNFSLNSMMNGYSKLYSS